MSHFLINLCQVKQNAWRVHRLFTADPSACVWTSAEICNGCLPFTKSFRKIRFGSKWNITFFGCSSGKCPGATEHLKRQSCFSGRNIPSRNSRSIFPSHPVRPSRSFSGKWNWFAQMVNEIPGRSKFTSPEFCVPFALTVDRPVCPCKWQTTDVNAFLPRGHRYYFRKKMYFFEFFYYNILRESHRYN